VMTSFLTMTSAF